MSIVIIGGNERMERRYSEICAGYGCKAKVYTKESSVRSRVGCPDLLIVFTNTVSHKMLAAAVREAKKNGTEILHVHSSSIAALSSALQEHCQPA